MLKRSFGYAAGAIYFFLSSYLMPLFLLIAFNYGKGIQNNEDGIMFIPLGVFLVITVLIIDVFIIRKALKASNGKRTRWLIGFVVLFIVVITVIITFSTWQTFFECLAHYKGFNLSPQR